MWHLDISNTSSIPNVGSIRAVPAAGMPAPAGLAIFSFRSGGVTVTQASVGAQSPGSSFRLYAEASGTAGQAGSIQSGLAVANASASAANVTLELTRLDGSSTGLTGTLSIPPNGQASSFLSEIQGLSGLQTPFQGVLRVSSSASISVVGLRGRYNERSDFLITTTPPINEAAASVSTALFFPHLADSGGYATQFVIFSGLPGLSSSGTLQLFSQSGQALGIALR